MLKTIKDNGDCVIAAIDFKGDVIDESVDVECKLMMTDFQSVNGHAIKNANYPEESPLMSKEWAATGFASKITLGLTIAAQHYGDKQVLCRLEPKTALLALQNYKKGELALVPCTAKIKIVDAQKGSTIATPTDEMLSCWGSAMPTGYSFHLSGSSTAAVCPAWFAQGTSNLKYVNLKVTMVEVEINGKIGQTKLATKDTSTVTVPIFVNTKAVDVGTELMFHKPVVVAEASKKRPFDAL
jgi:hypothetical protein